MWIDTGVKQKQPFSAAHGCTRQFTRYLLDSERTGRQQGPDLSIGKGDRSHTPDLVFGVVWGLGKI